MAWAYRDRRLGLSVSETAVLLKFQEDSHTCSIDLMRTFRGNTTTAQISNRITFHEFISRSPMIV